MGHRSTLIFCFIAILTVITSSSDLELNSTEVEKVKGHNESDSSTTLEPIATNGTNVSNVTSAKEHVEVTKQVPVPKEDVSKVVKAVCWDFRTMAPYPEEVEDKGNGKDDVKEEFEDDDVEEVEVTLKDRLMLGIPEEFYEHEEDDSPNSQGPKGIKVEESTTYPPLLPVSQSDQLKLVNRSVEIVNVTTLSDVLHANRQVRTKSMAGNCTMVLFFATWCSFCAKAAPHINALPRAYPPLRVVAIDTYKWRSVSNHFGVLSVPMLVLFHNGRVMAKFNETQFTLTKFQEFLEAFTNLKPEERMNVTAKDFEGPLPSTVERDRDWLLLISWIFLLVTGGYYITKSRIWWRFVEFVRITWMEAAEHEQIQHEHQD